MGEFRSVQLLDAFWINLSAVTSQKDNNQRGHPFANLYSWLMGGPFFVVSVGSVGEGNDGLEINGNN